MLKIGKFQRPPTGVQSSGTTRRALNSTARWIRSLSLRARAAMLLALVAMLVALPMLTPSTGWPASTRPVKDFAFSANQRMYRSDQRPEFRLQVPSTQPNNALGLFGVGRVYAAEDAITTTVSYKGHATDVPVDVSSLGKGDYKLALSPTSQTKPGKYTVTAKIKTRSGTVSKSQDFAWGVLAVNTTQATYAPGDTAVLQMAVLSSTGNTLCDAPLKLTVTAPDGTTAEPTIERPEDCRPDRYSDVPDYSATYKTTVVGTYKLQLQLADSDYILTDSFAVAVDQPFTIERTGPTRLYPSSPYTMKLKITANPDFKGVVREGLPAGFTVVSAEGAVVTPGKDGPTIDWTADWRAGQTHELTYAFKAPLVSPAFYFLKPLTLKSGTQTVYQEARAWQMAGDAIISFVKETNGSITVAATSHVISATSTSGNALVLLMNPRVNNGTTPQTISVTDSATNTWVSPASAPSTNPPYAWQGTGFTGYVMAYALNASAITQFTVTFTSSIDLVYSLVEFSNVATTSAVDASDAAGSLAATTHSTPTLATTNADDLIIGGIAVGPSATLALAAASSLPTSGYTELYAASTFLGIAYQVLAATGSYKIAMTTSASQTAGTGIMAFKNFVGCSPVTGDQMRGGNYFCNGVEAGFFWAG